MIDQPSHHGYSYISMVYPARKGILMAERCSSPPLSLASTNPTRSRSLTPIQHPHIHLEKLEEAGAF